MNKFSFCRTSKIPSVILEYGSDNPPSFFSLRARYFWLPCHNFSWIVRFAKKLQNRDYYDQFDQRCHIKDHFSQHVELRVMRLCTDLTKRLSFDSIMNQNLIAADNFFCGRKPEIVLILFILTKIAFWSHSVTQDGSHVVSISDRLLGKVFFITWQTSVAIRQFSNQFFCRINLKQELFW